MPRKKIEYKTEFNIVHVPLPPEMIEARKASLLLLLDWIHEERKKEEEEQKQKCPKQDEGGILNET